MENRHSPPVPHIYRNQRNRNRSRSEMPSTSRGFAQEFLPSTTASTPEHAMLLNHDEPEMVDSDSDFDSASDSQLSSLPSYSECARDMPPAYDSGSRRFLRGFRAGFARIPVRTRAVDEADVENAVTVEQQFVNSRLVRMSCSSPRHCQALQRHRSRHPHAWSEEFFMSESEAETRRAIAFMMEFALLMIVLAIVVGGIVYFWGPYGV
ncbi:hypothetical protein AC578_8972 [Pseudocercospora eumusae]|uniref:Uncharacterized protein n=1 Tax=Pseudocercospora eumusae TaxID=321146 RepID=A0A139HAA5_9PEZI|nr:hypothetical protein AC578_8972 [Pseudocercospora eumusae]